MFIGEIEAINRARMDFGALGAIDFSLLPFTPQRIYWLTDTKSGQTRGRHAHKNLSQCIFVMQGECDLRVQNSSTVTVLHLTVNSNLIYLKPGMWRELYNFSEGTVVCVLADAKYDEEDYIRNFDEYIAWVRNEN